MDRKSLLFHVKASFDTPIVHITEESKMQTVATILKKTFTNFWDELFFLTIFNVFTIFTLVIGLMIFLSGIYFVPPYIIIPIALICELLLPPAIFGLFGAVHEVGLCNAISVNTYFQYAKKFLKESYIWAGINVATIVILIVNIRFYLNVEAGWGIIIAFFFVGFTMTWIILQIFALTLYPKLESPSFLLAIRNAMIIVSTRPVPTLSVMGILAMIFILGNMQFLFFFFIVLFVLNLLAFMALLVNITTVEVLAESQSEESQKP
ncbi:MAG: hypothetical protein B6242_06350 [Anaerolineaceae bacterium 4572_78]|nr:MAG: hypothetical protein B6242_06350 [Anaerolineaceae bacterium 4572_78]